MRKISCLTQASVRLFFLEGNQRGRGRVGYVAGAHTLRSHVRPRTRCRAPSPCGDRSMRNVFFLAVAGVLATCSIALAQAAHAPAYALSARWNIGGDGGWDYL